MKKLSLAASLLLLSSSVALADSSSIKDAFSKGTVAGDISAYSVMTDAKGGNADSGFTSVGTSLSYTTASYMGLTAKIGFVAASDIDEVEDNDSADLADNSILSEANVTYAQDTFSVTVGRQAIDLEWLGDYNEAIVVATTVIPDTTLVLGYTDKQAVAGVDEISAEFGDVNGTKGAYVIDAKYAGVEGLELNPYYYTASDAANYYGLKATYSTDMFAAVAQYAKSSEKVAGTEDGSIFNAELSTSIEGLSLAAGYIKTDKNGGVGSISGLGDNVSPFEDGNYAYGGEDALTNQTKNEKTYYATLGYSIAGVDLGLVYGKTKYDTTTTTGDTEKELDLSVGYSFSDELSASLVYVDVNAESAADDYSKIVASLTYAF